MAYNVPLPAMLPPTTAPEEFFKMRNALAGMRQRESLAQSAPEARRLQNALLQLKIKQMGQPKQMTPLDMARINLMQQQTRALGGKGVQMGINAQGLPVPLPSQLQGRAQQPQQMQQVGQQQPQQMQQRGQAGPVNPLMAAFPSQSQGLLVKSPLGAPSRGGAGAMYVNPKTGEQIRTLTRANISKLENQNIALTQVVPMLEKLIEAGSQGVMGPPTILQPNARANYNSQLNNIVERMVAAQTFPSTNEGMARVESIYGRGPAESVANYKSRTGGELALLKKYQKENKEWLRRGVQVGAPQTAPTLQLRPQQPSGQKILSQDTAPIPQRAIKLAPQQIQTMSNLSHADLVKIAGGG